MEDKIKELGLLLGKANKLFEEIQNTPTSDPADSKPKFEKGKWYILETGFKWLLRFERIDEEGVIHGYIYDCDLEYFNTATNLVSKGVVKSYRPATPEEVKQALVKEAERKYSVPCKIKYLNGNIESLLGHSLRYDSNTDILHASDGYTQPLYSKGQWAEIIPQEEVIKIGGYNLKVEGDVAVFGCKKFTADELTELKHIMHENDFKTVQFDKHEPVTLETINSILNKLK